MQGDGTNAADTLTRVSYEFGKNTMKIDEHSTSGDYTKMVKPLSEKQTEQGVEGAEW